MKPTLNIVIRNAIPADALLIVDILQSSWLATYVPLGIPKFEIEKSFSNLAERISALSSYLEHIDNSNDIGLVAVCDDEVIGICFGAAEEKYFTLTQLYLKPSSIGQGIGSLLLQNFIQKTNNHPIKLSVFDKNAHAIDFYMAHGFKDKGELSEFKLSSSCVLPEKVLYYTA